jgi:hypothetical protein
VPYYKSRQQEHHLARNHFQEKALELLAQGFSQDFADFISSDQRYIDVMSELVNDFIDENIPVVDEQDKFDLSFLLIDKVYVKATVYKSC